MRFVYTFLLLLATCPQSLIVRAAPDPELTSQMIYLYGTGRLPHYLHEKRKDLVLEEIDRITGESAFKQNNSLQTVSSSFRTRVPVSG